MGSAGGEVALDGLFGTRETWGSRGGRKPILGILDPEINRCVQFLKELKTAQIYAVIGVRYSSKVFHHHFELHPTSVFQLCTFRTPTVDKLNLPVPVVIFLPVEPPRHRFQILVNPQ